MTTIYIPAKPEMRLKWAHNILKKRDEIKGAVSGPDIIAIATAIVGTQRQCRNSRIKRS